MTIQAIPPMRTNAQKHTPITASSLSNMSEDRSSIATNATPREVLCQGCRRKLGEKDGATLAVKYKEFSMRVMGEAMTSLTCPKCGLETPCYLTDRV